MRSNVDHISKQKQVVISFTLLLLQKRNRRVGSSSMFSFENEGGSKNIMRGAAEQGEEIAD